MDSHQYLNKENICRSTEFLEYHPLIPFLPANCKVLFLGSFPPQMSKWSKDFYFYYPNFINDHWRIEGLLFYNNKDYFIDKYIKTFNLERIIEFLQEKGIGFFDTATAVHRLKNNASDQFLEIIESTNINNLLQQIPECKIIAVTGQKAAESICGSLLIEDIPKIGHYIYCPKTSMNKREIVIYRLPSSSRAYPLSLEKKALAYKEMYRFAGLL